MKTYDCILFDWDGCLAKSVDVWLEASEVVLRRRGLTISRQKIFDCLGKQGIMRELKVPQSDACQDELVALARAMLRQVALYEGARTGLAKLSATKRLAIVSDCRREILSGALAYHKLDAFFDTTVARGESGQLKPHPDGIKQALRELQTPARRALMVGDTDKDLLAAKRAGVDSVFFCPPSHEAHYNTMQWRSMATYVVRSHHELARLVAAR